MKKKQFTVDLTKPVDDFLSEAQQVAKENNATLTGDSQSGQFSHEKVKGTYKIENSVAHVTITKKPWYAPWSVVESEVRSFFG